MLIKIKKIEDEQTKRKICRDILTKLTEWFGINKEIDNYEENSATMPFWTAYYEDELVGFIALKHNSIFAAEIYVMGVLKSYHNKGIGKQLFNTCYNWCKENNYEFLQVKTLDKSHTDKNYAKTRKYYQAIGFKELECIPEIWGKQNPCLIMIMNIK